jgi:hypothetical protein
VDQLAQQRTQTLQLYAEKHLRKMMVSQNGCSDGERIETVRKEEMNCDKENRRGNRPDSAVRKEGVKQEVLKQIQIYLSDRKHHQECSTGRFRVPSEAASNK